MTKLTIIVLFSIIVPSLCQYAISTGLRPDVTFGEENDRFDVTNLIRKQTKHLKPNLDPQSEEFRRRNNPKHKKKKDKNKIGPKDLPWPKLLASDTGRTILRQRIKEKLEDHVNNLANTIINKIRSMRRNQEFAYHDNMNSEGGDVEDFNTNLRAFENDGDFEGDDTKYESFRRRNEDDDNYTVPQKRNNLDFRRRRRLQGIVDKLHGVNQTRRVAMDPEREILFHYAFPLDMKIEGFLQAPMN